MVILQTCRRLRPCSTMQSGPNGLSYSDVLYPLLEFIPIWGAVDRHDLAAVDNYTTRDAERQVHKE